MPVEVGSSSLIKSGALPSLEYVTDISALQENLYSTLRIYP